MRTKRLKVPRLGRRRSLAAVAAAFLAALLLTLLSRQEQPSEKAPAALPAGRRAVTRVYDGDTIEVAGVGKVRLIGIDALDGYNAQRMLEQSRELGMPAEAVKRWSDEATKFARDLLKGQSVALIPGPEEKDAYGRTLAYVECGPDEDPKDLGLLMLAAGLAIADRKSAHPRQEDYRNCERAAREQRAGLWQHVRRIPQP